jgi:cysteine protease ATG4
MESMLHRQIIRLFGDFPNNDSPFSIQHLVRIGVDHGKRPGDWYGPASVAYVIRLVVFMFYLVCEIFKDYFAYLGTP